jgi:hypothetical protein
MMRLAMIADEAVDMPALPQAVADHGGEERKRQAGSEKARKALFERNARGASANAA